MVTEKMWFSFKSLEFDFEDRTARIIFPDKANEKRSWVLKTEYFGAFPESEIELLKRGYHVAYVSNTSRWAPKIDCDVKARFADYLIKTYGLAARLSLIGMSAGGAHAVNFAGFYPDLISSMYIDAPVLNFADMPGDISVPFNLEAWQTDFKSAYPNVTRADLTNFDNHPIGKVPVLIEHKIPILLLYGTNDELVRYVVHGKLMEELYENHKELLTVMKRDGEGHHPHGFPNNPEIIADFIESNYR